MTPFDGKCQNLGKSDISTFTIFAKVLHERTKAADRQTHRNGQTHSYRRNRKFPPKGAFPLLQIIAAFAHAVRQLRMVHAHAALKALTV